MNNNNLQKIVKNSIGGASNPAHDFGQYRGVTDNAGGVFSMAKREVTEFDLKLVHKH